MKNENFEKFFKDKNYDGLRYYLFTQSYVANEVKLYIRGKYNLSGDQTNASWFEYLLSNFSHLYDEVKRRWSRTLRHPVEIDSDTVWIFTREVERLAIPEIKRLSDNLDFNETLLRIFMVYGTIPDKLSGKDSIYFASRFGPITDVGVYIKIDNDSTDLKLKSDIKKAKDYLRAFNFGKNEEKIKMLGIKNRRKQIARSDQIKTKAYLLVESNIITLKRENKEKRKQDYGKSLTMVAFENAAGDLLADASDKDFKKLEKSWTRSVRNYYYDVTKRYRLPTSKKLESILKLIS